MLTNEELARAVVSQQAAIDELRQEVAALRGQGSPAPSRSAVVSRRALLGLAGTGIATAAVTAMGSPAAAADGDPLTLGQDNQATQTTELATPDGTALRVISPNLPLLVEGGDKGAWVHADDPGGIAVQASATGGLSIGVHATGTLMGVAGTTTDGWGIGGQSDNGSAGVLATRSGDHLLLERSGPDPDDHSSGATYGRISLDAGGGLNYAPGETGDTWTRLNDQGPVFLPTPQRAFDSRATTDPVPGGGVKGKFGRKEVRRIDLTIATDVPMSARAAILNLTVLSTEAPGYLAVFPAGAPGTNAPSFVNLIWWAAGLILGNTTFANLENGCIDVHAASRTHVSIDVIGYYR